MNNYRRMNSTHSPYHMHAQISVDSFDSNCATRLCMSYIFQRKLWNLMYDWVDTTSQEVIMYHIWVLMQCKLQIQNDQSNPSYRIVWWKQASDSDLRYKRAHILTISVKAVSRMVMLSGCLFCRSLSWSWLRWLMMTMHSVLPSSRSCTLHTFYTKHVWII